MRGWLLIAVWLIEAGCSLWRMPAQDEFRVTELTPAPGIPLMENPISSSSGDLLVFLPQGWFPLQLGERAPTGTVVVGVNPEYTLGLVVALLRRPLADTSGQYDLLELAQQSFARHQARSAGSLRLISDFAAVRVGPKSFVTYRFSDGARSVRVAVFVSSIGSVYELALFPLTVRPIQPPGEEECERLFHGVLRAIQF